MKSVSKKILSLVLAAMMVLSLATVAFATNSQGSRFKFDTNIEDPDAPAIITGFVGTVTDGTFVVVDEQEIIEDLVLPFNKVKDNAFNYSEDDDKVAFANDVKAIEVEAGIEEIGKNAFANFPKVESITFKGDIKLGEGAFAACPRLKEVVFEGNAVIGKAAFDTCERLQQVVFKGNADLGENAFADCVSLATINVKSDAEFDAAKGALNDTAWFYDKDAKNDFIMVNTTLIAYTGLDKEVSIPLNVTKIGKAAFEGNANIKKVTITRYVDTLGDRAFANCPALEEVIYADYCDIVNVGADVFVDTPYYDNYEGEFFTISDVLVKYKGDDVSFVIIPNTIKHIADEAFMGCYKYNEKDGYTFVIDAILVPASVETFGDRCFALVTYEDGTMYSPRIFAYKSDDTAKLLEEAGYLVNAMNMPGDVDGDGEITAADAREALRIAVNKVQASEEVRAAADIDRDGNVTAADARLILRLVVNLEGYTAEDLINKPATTYEVLSAYKNAVKTAEKYGMGYIKTVSNKLTSSDINKAHRDRLEGIALKNAVNQTYLYTANSKVAKQNLPDIGLLSTKQIKSVVSNICNGNYVLTINFPDLTDANLDVNNQEYNPAAADFMKLIPTVKGDVFYNALASDKSVGSLKWWNFVEDSNTIKANCVRKYQMTYTNPSITIVIDKESGTPETITMSVGYKFALDGRINGLDISSAKFKTGDAIINRLDSVTYSNFGYEN